MTLTNYFTRHDDYTEYIAGDTIFNVGDASDGKLYAVKEGEVALILNNTVLETITAGYFFGELGLVDSSPRRTNAVAKTDCKIVAIDRYQFLFLMHETAVFNLQMLRVIGERIDKLHRKIDDSASTR